MNEAKVAKKTIVIALGSNLGNRYARLVKADQLLCGHFSEATMRSSAYETDAWGITDQPRFLNAVYCYTTDKSPLECMQIIQAIEKKLGRVRHEKWGPRAIDLDILYYSDECINESELKIPHPHIAERDFVLRPLCEVMPDFVNPMNNLSNAKMWEQLKAYGAPGTFHIF